MERNLKHQTKQNIEMPELTSEEILLEALASKNRVRENLVELIKSRSSVEQRRSTLALEPQVDIKKILELA
jgi:hypothetical protein